MQRSEQSARELVISKARTSWDADEAIGPFSTLVLLSLAGRSWTFKSADVRSDNSGETSVLMDCEVDHGSTSVAQAERVLLPSLRLGLFVTMVFNAVRALRPSKGENCESD
jgi:hypothetical protein